MAQINPRTFADAKQLADNIYELILTNWGNIGSTKDADNGSLQYPPIKSLANGAIPEDGQIMLPPIPGLAAIAIAPRSDCDRAIIRYSEFPQTPSTFQNIPTVPPSVNPPNQPIPAGFFNAGGILQSEQIVAVGAPIIGVQPGPIVIRAHPSGWFGDKPIGGGGYVPLGGITQPYGTALGYTPAAGPQDAPVWINPELRLLLYLQGSAALPPTIRAPLSVTWLTTLPVANALIRVVPIMGRRHVRVMVRNGTAAAMSVTLTGTFPFPGVASGFVPPSLPPVVSSAVAYEVPLVGATAIAGDQGVVLAVDHPGVTFLNIIASGAGIAASARISVEAFD